MGASLAAVTHEGRPTRTRVPSTMASTPCPGVDWNDSGSGMSRPRSRAARTSAPASGCSERDSAAATNLNKCSSFELVSVAVGGERWPAIACAASSMAMPTNSGRPTVSVPVLSNAITRTSASASSDAPPLKSTPCRAPFDTAATMVAGIEITKAQGDATTSSVMAR